jgi:hypothetical protein
MRGLLGHAAQVMRRLRTLFANWTIRPAGRLGLCVVAAVFLLVSVPAISLHAHDRIDRDHGHDQRPLVDHLLQAPAADAAGEDHRPVDLHLHVVDQVTFTLQQPIVLAVGAGHRACAPSAEGPHPIRVELVTHPYRPPIV